MPRTGRPRIPPEVRFWAKVEKTETCWLWTAYITKFGYGRFRKDGAKSYGIAHRMSWEMNVGPIPKGMFVCHRCDVPRCVRPDHLFLGTAADNNQDMIAKGRGRHLRGEEQPAAKLTTWKVIHIRKLATNEGWNHQRLSELFGVTREAITAVVNRWNWEHVA